MVTEFEGPDQWNRERIHYYPRTSYRYAITFSYILVNVLTGDAGLTVVNAPFTEEIYTAETDYTAEPHNIMAMTALGI